MRKHVTQIVCLTLVAATIGFVQIPVAAHDGMHPDAPNPSPNATASQEVGYASVSLAYGRPGVKGRNIWGELVPYNEGQPRPWMGGANGSTVITFAEDVKINGNAVAAGSYGLFWIPAKDKWTIILNSDSSKFGIMKYTADNDVLRVTATPEKADFQEWLSYEFEKTGELTADLNLHWDRIKVGMSIEASDHRTAEELKEQGH